MSRHDPDAILDRAETRARRKLDAARNDLADRARDVVDLPTIVRRHPLVSLAVAAAAGIALAAPARKLPASAARATAPLRRVLAPLVPVAARALLAALIPED